MDGRDKPGHDEVIREPQVLSHVVIAKTSQRTEERSMRGILLWLIGIPIPIIILLWLFGVLH